MPFQWSDRHLEEYHLLGYTVFRGIVPPVLIDELRRECDRAASLVRERQGGQAQRFQPVSAYPVSQKPFAEFQNLPELRDAISRLCPFAWEVTGLDLMGVLIEPAGEPYCTPWHRDWRDNIPGLDVPAWEADYRDPELFNQANCALYEDSCTWVVPGSHRRLDSEAEIARFPERPIPGPALDGLSSAGRERACLDYCESLPGAQRLLLDAGDYCLYRNTLWHLGNYIPYRKRATLHDGVMTPKFRAWWATAQERASERVAQGLIWENPRRAAV